jgi:hypothetical protein
VLHVDHEAHYGAEVSSFWQTATSPGPDSRLNAPQWASFGATTLGQWLAAGDEAVAAATGDSAVPCELGTGEVAVQAAAAVRRRCVGVSFLGPDAATDAPPAARRGFSVDLAGPKVWGEPGTCCACRGARLRVL